MSVANSVAASVATVNNRSKRNNNEIGKVVNSPEPKGGRFDQGEGLNEKFDKMMDMMTRMETNMTTMKQEIKEEVAEDVKTICKQELQQVNNRLTALESNRRTPATNHTTTDSRKHEIDESDVDRKMQIIVSGVGQDQTAEAIIKALQEIVQIVTDGSQDVQVDSLGSKGTGSLGVLTFPSVGKKIDFYKAVQQCNDINDKYRFFDNLTFPERIRDKRLGLLRHHMISNDKYTEADVRVRWRKHMVTLKDKKIAWYDHNDEFQMTKAAKQFEKEVETSLKKWIAKRSSDPETDSE